MTVCVGIDVSKAQLDIAVRPTGTVTQVANTGAGIATVVHELQVLGPNEALPGQAVLLRAPDSDVGIPGTGLVGSPEPGDKGIVKADALIQPNLNPGQKFQLEAAEINGLFRIQRCVYNGDTWGNEWNVSLEGKPIAA